MRRGNFLDMNPDDQDGFGDLRIDPTDYRVEPVDFESMLRFARQYYRNQQRIARFDADERARQDWGRILAGPAGGLLSNVFAKMAGREGA